MYKPAIKEDLGIGRLPDLIKYQINFNKEHPYFFKPCGTCIFTGPQGSGKTLSAVNYLYNIMEAFPYCIVVTNISLEFDPFNAHLHNRELISDIDGAVITSETILSGQHKRVVVEYDGLDCLKYISNGEYGVVYLIDEFHLELNSLESKNIDIDVITEISQQRKQRKHIIGTSQIFLRLAKPVREQVFDIVLCNNYFKWLQWNKLVDGTTVVEENGKVKGDVKSQSIYFHSPDMYARYDTYAKMKRLNKEWQGHVREPVDFFASNRVQ